MNDGKGIDKNKLFKNALYNAIEIDMIEDWKVKLLYRGIELNILNSRDLKALFKNEYMQIYHIHFYPSLKTLELYVEPYEKESGMIK